MKKTKIIALLLAALMVTAAFAGCGKNAAPAGSPDAGQSAAADKTPTPPPRILS